MKIITKPDGLYLEMPCPKLGTCRIPVNKISAGVTSRGNEWFWDGNELEPTITPSIGCDIPPRCGQHRVIVKGKY